MSKKETLFKSIIPFKSSLQSTLTSIMYKFKHQNKNVNIWMERNSQYIFVNLFDYFIENYNVDKLNIWDKFRFYLKGGKALNKLLRKICIEDKYKMLLSDAKTLLEQTQDKCFVNTELFPSSDTDYDFTLLIGKENFSSINNFIVKLFNSISEFMNKQQEFIIFKNALLEHVNKPENIKKIQDSITTTINDMRTSLLIEKNETVKSYWRLKIAQLLNFVNNIEKVLSERSDMFTQANVVVSYNNSPIVIENSSFYLYRLKLFFNLNPVFFNLKKTNKDIKDFLMGINDVNSIPFDNTFAELIDLSIPTGDNKYLEKLWEYTKYTDMLQPISYFQPNIKEKTLYRYPVVSLRHQMNDIMTIFNTEGATKLSKRCGRFLEFLKILCNAEKIPEEFTIYISKELRKEIFARKSQCHELIKVVNFLSNKMQFGTDMKILVRKEELLKTFPEYCNNKFQKNFLSKDMLVKSLLKSSMKFNFVVSEENLRKLNTESLEKLEKIEKLNENKDNKDNNFEELMHIVASMDEIERIIPLYLMI